MSAGARAGVRPGGYHAGSVEVLPGAVGTGAVPAPRRAAGATREGEARQSAPRRLLAPAAALLLYLGLSIALLSGTLTGGTGVTVGGTADPGQFIWYLAWLPFALAHHLNPLVTAYLRAPRGANLMWNTPVTFPALVLSPVTVLLGPLATYNVLAVLGFTLSSWCAYLAVRRYTGAAIPAVAGGLIYGFSPYMLAQSAGHTNLELAMFPPLALLLCDEILVRQRRSPWLLGGLLGFAAAAQLLTSSEMLAITAILAVPALLLAGIWHRALLRERWTYAVRAMGMALIVFAVLSAFPLAIEFLGPRRPQGVFQTPDYYVATLRNFVMPTSRQWLAVPGRAASPDSSAYVGIPLLAVAVVTLVWLRRRAVVWAAILTVAAGMVFSLGGYLGLRGARTGIPLPWLVFDHLPLTDQILPIRVMDIAYLGLALLVGVVLDRALRWRRPASVLTAGLAAALVAVSLWPSTPYPSNHWRIPAFFSNGAAAAIAPGSIVYMPPDKRNLEALVWQAVAGMRFRTQLGWVFTPAPLPQPWITEFDALGTELYSLGELGRTAPVRITPTERTTYLADLAATRASTVIIGPEPGEGQEVAFMTRLLGRPGRRTGGVVIWTGVGRTQQR